MSTVPSGFLFFAHLVSGKESNEHFLLAAVHSQISVISEFRFHLKNQNSGDYKNENLLCKKQ